MDDRASEGERAAQPGGPRRPYAGGRDRLLAGAFLALAVLVGLLGGIAIDRTLLTPPVAAVAAGTGVPVADTAVEAGVPDTAASPVRPGTGTRASLPDTGATADDSGAAFSAGGRVLAWMADSLDLTPEQRTRIGAIVREERRRARELTVRLRPRYQQVLRRTRLRVVAVLTPEQRVRLRRLLAERRTRRAGADSFRRRPRR